jgi:cell division protein FtsB
MHLKDYGFVILFFIILGVSANWLLPVYGEWHTMQKRAKRIKQSIVEQQDEAQELRRKIEALKNNPYEIERTAREKRGWCKENEKIYRFD